MSTNDFASAGLTVGQLNAIVKKLGGRDMALSFLRGELMVSEPARKWREQNGVIYFSVTSDGTTGEEWINRLDNKGFRIGYYAESVLRSPDFKPTTGTVYNCAVIKGELFSDEDRITQNIHAEADRRKLGKPNAEVACLMREKFSDEDIKAMGLRWLVAMHEPIKDSGGSPNLLGACNIDGSHELSAYYSRHDGRYLRGLGFVFLVPKV